MRLLSLVGLLPVFLAACDRKPGAEACEPVQIEREDDDLDGYLAEGDCDDADAAVHPSAEEICDGRDNDCDGQVDDETASDALTWYLDSDGDGYGDAAGAVVSCEQPDGYVADGSDCDDAADVVYPGADELCDGVDNNCDGRLDEESAIDADVWYVDADGDGYGDAGSSVASCDQPAGYVADDTDCDDAQSASNPAGSEICDDLDNDCDGTADEGASDAPAWYADGDGDGYGDAASSVLECDQPAGYVADNTDCDDGLSSSYPGNDEICDDLDNDCDLQVDEDSAIDAGTWYADLDGDGYGDPASPAAACDQPAGYLADGTDCDDSWDAVYPGAPELCDDYDNDCDKAIDEDAGDYDGDGLSDCDDADCDLTEPTAGDATIDETCLVPDIVVSDPWNVVEEWRYTMTSVSAYAGPLVMPAVGNLTDDDGDGDVDEDDVPDIVFTGYSTDELIALHGDGSGEIFRVSGYDGNAGVAIVDADQDGESEVIALTTGYKIAAVDATGAQKWLSAAVSLATYPQPTAADLDADGDVEVIFDKAVVSGATGATIATLGGTLANWRTPVVADLDQDGTMEIVLGQNVYGHTGALEWSTTASGSGSFSAVADIDGDDGGEVFFVSGTQMRIHDANGTLLYGPITVPGSNPGPPCVADFDGDGGVEIAVPANTNLSVFELNGTQNWTASVADSSGLAGCSGYDVDGDGVYEVLYADQSTFWMFDGATGTVRYSNPDHDSGTLWEYPVVADVDKDGSAEIIVASSDFGYGTWNGIAVLGHAGDGWAASGSTWPVHDFAVTNVNPDGSVPTDPVASWLVDNVFRARPSVDTARSDLQIAISDACASSCDPAAGVVEVAVQISNVGAADVSSDVSVSLYADNGGVLTWLAVEVLAGGLEGGTSSDGLLFAVPVDSIGADGLVAVVDDLGDGSGGAITECDEANNEADWDGLTCE